MISPAKIAAACGFGLLAILAGPAEAQYTLEDVYDATNFFDQFSFFTGPDPTNGYVEYVDAETADAQQLAGYTDGNIFMGVDYVTANPANGRRSVRLTSNKAFTHGLFVADIAHMPGSICGTWPAFWMFGPNWPSSGEIDMIEGVNTQTATSITLHTSPECSVSNWGSLESTELLSAECGADGGSTGCSQATSTNQNYGDGFNDIGGGVYATEWSSDAISVWFFPRSSIPGDIASESPEPSSWGTPQAKFLSGDGGCDIDSHFQNNNLVFDTTFCGDWAGSVWDQNDECTALAPSCEDYVANNPGDFAESYWSVNSVKVYQNTGAWRKRDLASQAFAA